MSVDTYPSIFSRQMAALVYIYFRPTIMFGVPVFFAMIVADLEVFLWALLVKQLFHSRLVAMR